MLKSKIFSGKQKILVVDDEVDIASIVGERLSESGYEICVEWDPREALKKLKTESFDLVVTDLKMPYIDGFQLMAWMKDFSPLTKVVVITAHGSPSSHRAALNKGAVLYIEKPFDLDEFAVKIADILEPPKDFKAKIESISPFDLIQMVAVSGGERRISVKSAQGNGEMFIMNGKLIYAKANKELMKKAFYRMLTWETGTFNVLPWIDPPSKFKPKDVNILLLEAARLMDEGKSLIREDNKQGIHQKKSNEIKIDNIDKLDGIDAAIRVDFDWKVKDSYNISSPNSIIKAAFFLNEWGKKIGSKFDLSTPEEIILHAGGRDLWIKSTPNMHDILILSPKTSYFEIRKRLKK